MNMKRKIIFFAMSLALTGIIVLQSCTKEEGVPITVQQTFNLPVAAAPSDGGTIAPATTTTLTWTSTGGAAEKWDVYFGESHSPALLESDYTSQSIEVDVAEGKTYYWRVINTDANGIVVTSPLFSFTVEVNMNIDNFVGLYDCDEPGYTHYDVNLTKVNSTTISNDNFWDSGWVVEYQFDNMGNVTLISKTIKTSSTVTYDITGSGTYDNTTGEFIVDYEVWKNTYTLKLEGNTVVRAQQDANTHTFVKKVI
jgi:hypothetical protein